MRALITFSVLDLVFGVAIGVPLDLAMGKQYELVTILLGVGAGTLLASYITHRRTGVWIWALGSSRSRSDSWTRRSADDRERDTRRDDGPRERP